MTGEKKTEGTIPDDAADHVQKKPQGKDSPQQTHDNEDNG